jgi:two-component system, OmpR family, sensor kinase
LDTAPTPPERVGPLFQQLLAIQTPQLAEALTEAAHAVHEVFGADKADTFLLDAPTQTLVAVGTSDTPMGHRQHELGLHLQPLANGGRSAWVYTHQTPFMSNHLDEDPEELPGLIKELEVRSTLITPLYVDGELQGVVSACSAQPERFSQADLELLTTIAHWIGLVAHRSHLVDQTVQQAVEQAKRATAEDLLVTVAHDFRNYLTPLKSWLEVLEQRLTGSTGQGAIPELDRVVRGIDRLSYLVDDLLDVARLEHGIFDLSRESVELTSLVADLCTALRTPERELALESTGEVQLLGDRNRLGQALHNLLANALAHSPPRQPVQVRVHTVFSDGTREAIVTIQDQGPGIDPEVLPHLFERFSPGPGSSGLGIGLYVAERIAAAHGGSLTVDEAPGPGAQFRLVLPLSVSFPPSG